jgi:hypothetical protein
MFEDCQVWCVNQPKELMPKPISIKIPPDDVYGIIQALEYYLESWKATETYCRDGIIYDGPIHEDCRDPQTAHRQVLLYAGVLRRFHRELDNLTSTK